MITDKDMTKEQFFKWLDDTSPGRKGLTLAERSQLAAMRKDAAKKAGTTLAYIRLAKCRGKIGADLLSRISIAIK